MYIEKNKIEDMSEGDTFSFTKEITEENVIGFSEVSGDINPLHMNDDFAKRRGFEGRVVYGGLLVGYLSRLVGVHFPGENCIIHTINLKFLAPAYICDIICVKAKVEQISNVTKVIVLKVKVRNKNTGTLLVRGKIQVGFTNK